MNGPSRTRQEVLFEQRGERIAAAGAGVVKFRYRVLSRRDDVAGYIAEVKAQRLAQQQARQTFHEHHPVLAVLFRQRGGTAISFESSHPDAVDNLVGMPSVVDVDEEGEVGFAGLRMLLTSGKLKPEDLVDDGSGWRCARDCPALFDYFAEKQERASRIKATALWAAAALIGSVTAGVVLWMLT